MRLEVVLRPAGAALATNGVIVLKNEVDAVVALVEEVLEEHPVLNEDAVKIIKSHFAILTLRSISRAPCSNFFDHLIQLPNSIIR